MFGTSYRGWFGTSSFLFNSNATPLETAFFLFQLMFCGTAITIVSGAVAERMGFVSYIVLAIIMASCIYPIVGHWARAGALKEGAVGWLERMGFIDFAGSTIVQSVGGWVALAAVIIIGPRLGRFDSGMDQIPGSNLPLSLLGVFLLWFGWFGFNGGSTLAINEAIPLILLNTCLSALFGGIGAALIKWLSQGRLDVTMVINGVMGGLAGITASWSYSDPNSGCLYRYRLRRDRSLGASVVESFENRRCGGGRCRRICWRVSGAPCPWPCLVILTSGKTATTSISNCQ